MTIELAVETDIPYILEILKQRCEWFKQNKIKQWGKYYYTELYNEEYFIKIMKMHLLYVVKQKNQIIGVFLLKDEDIEYWNDKVNAYYIHHFATKVGYPEIGTMILEFIENLARKNQIEYLRLDCMKTNEKLNRYYKNYGFENKGEGERPPYSYRLWEKRVK